MSFFERGELNVETISRARKSGERRVDRTTVASFTPPEENPGILVRGLISERLVDQGTNLGPFHFRPHNVYDVEIVLVKPFEEAAHLEPVLRTRTLVNRGEFLTSKHALKTGLKHTS